MFSTTLRHYICGKYLNGSALCAISRKVKIYQLFSGRYYNMIRIRKISLAFIILFLAAGCSSRDESFKPKYEVASYDEKIIKLEKVNDFEIKSQSGSIEIFCWDRNEMKMEITRRIRGTAGKEILTQRLSDIDVNTGNKDGKIKIASSYSGKKAGINEVNSDLKLTLPRQLSDLTFNIENGKINVLDDLKCNLNIFLKKGNIDIKKIEGRFYLKTENGNIDIEDGNAFPESKIAVGNGNINVRAKYEGSGVWNYETGAGNVKLRIPSSTQVYVECVGITEKNEFASVGYPAKIRVGSGLGKIIVLEEMKQKAGN